MKKIKGRIISVILTVLLILGILPGQVMPVYGAGVYNLHKVKDPREYAKQSENGKMAYITNLADSSLDIMNGSFFAADVPEIKRTLVYLDKSQLPEKGKEKSWKNIAKVTFKNAGYTSDGTIFNLEYTLAGLKMTGMTDSEPPENTEMIVMDITDTQGIVSRSGFCVLSGEKGDIGYISKATPYTRAVWNFTITDSDGNPMDVPPVLMLFKDIDAANVYNGISAKESIKAISGFSEDVYIADNSYLQVSEQNSLFEAGQLTENEDPRSQLLLIMDETTASIEWRGMTCGTYITPMSVTGYPIPGNEKKVDQISAMPGDTLHYSIYTDFPLISEDNAATSITVTDTLNDILDIENAVFGVLRDNTDVSDAWNIQINGQTVSWKAKEPGSVVGGHTFTVTVNIRKDMLLDGRRELYIGNDGLLYYRIPNSDSLVIKDHNGEEIIILPTDIPETDIPVGGISLVKEADRSMIENAHEGDILNYSFTIANTGLVSLGQIALTDSLDVKDLQIDWKSSSEASSPSGTLLPGETVKGTAEYTLTQADIDSGLVHNTASVTGTDPLNVSYTDTDEEDTVLGRNPAIDLVKDTTSRKLSASAGDRIEYRFDVRNTGNVALSSVTFEDDHELVDVTWDKDFSMLLPGEEIHGSAFYVLTHDDVDRKTVLNTATVAGTSPDGITVTDTDDALTELALEPGILLEKTSEPSIRTNAQAGDVVPFLFTVTNTGNCTLTDFAVEDALEGISDVLIDWSSSSDESTGEDTLAGGESVTGEAFYTLTQEDIDRGKIVNTACVTASDPDGTIVRSDDEASVLLPENGEIEIVKESAGGIDENTVAGDTVHYIFTVTNTGNVTLTDVSITDDLPGLGIITYAWDESSDPETPNGTLSPGETVSASADYVLTQEDIDRGEVKNVAEADGITPSGKNAEASDDDSREIPSRPEISLVKEVNRASYEDVKAGDTLRYTLTAANTGKCTLTGVSFADEAEGFDQVIYDWSGASEGEGILRPGEIVRVQFTYSISQKDINNGAVVNTAVVTGISPDHSEVSATDTVETALSQTGMITVTKSANVLKMENAGPGDEIIYTMTAENIGNQTLSNVDFTDEKEGLGDLEINWAGPSGEHVLEPGEKVTARAVYKISREDIENESTANTVVVHARTPNGEEVEPAEDTVTTPITRKDSLKVTKTVDRSVIADARVGDKLNYTIKVTNDGNTVLHEITLTDELAGIADADCDWQGASMGKGILLPGESMTAATSYCIQQSDIDRGSVKNTVLATALNSKDEPTGPVRDDATTQIGGKSAFTITKTVDKASLTNAVPGEVLTYTVTGKNTGSVTLTEVSLKDTLKDVTAFTYDWSEATAGDGILLPGESVYATCTYTVKQADISSGKVENTAFMSAKQPNGTTVEKEARVTTLLKRDPTPTPTPVRVTGSQASSSGGSASTGNKTAASSPSQTSGTVTSRTGPVRTGDESHPGLWLIVGAGTLIGMILLARRKKTDV